LSKPNTLTTQTPGAELLLYVSATGSAVSAVLVEEQENEHTKRQVLVYFVSEALSGSKIYYLEIEKNSLCSFNCSKKIKALFPRSQNQSTNKLCSKRSIAKL
jgi:hypothetical protein